MAPAFDLILQRHGALHTETVQVSDAAEAWRLGHERYPHSIRAVVCRDDTAVPGHRRYNGGTPPAGDGAAP